MHLLHSSCTRRAIGAKGSLSVRLLLYTVSDMWWVACMGARHLRSGRCWRASLCDRRLAQDSFTLKQLRNCSAPADQQLTTVIFTQTVAGHTEQLSVDLADGRLEASRAAARGHQPWSLNALRSSLRRQLAATFLPAGYPASVAPGYLRFVWWQALHHCAGSVNGVLASTFLLYSVGLGAGAIPTAGALNWVLKDGLGQLGTLLFGKAIAHSFDVNARAWYLAASAKLNVAMGLEVCTLLAPAYFLPLGALANAVKGLAWMSGGSSRSAFNVAFAVDSNIADLTAKATSQTICTSMAGTAAGIALASCIGQSVELALTSFAAVAAVHMYTSYTSVRCVPLSTLNPTRLQLLVSLYLRQVQQQTQQQVHRQAQRQQQQRQRQQRQRQQQQQQQQQRQQWQLPQMEAQQQAWEAQRQRERPAGEGSPQSKEAHHERQQQQEEELRGKDLAVGGRLCGAALPSPHEMAQLEPLLPTRHWHSSSGLPMLHIGASLQDLYGRDPQQAAALLPLFVRERHLAIPAPSGLSLIFHEDASAQDCILAVLHGHLLQQSMQGAVSWGQHSMPSSGPGSNSSSTSSSASSSSSSSGDATPALDLGQDRGRATLAVVPGAQGWAPSRGGTQAVSAQAVVSSLHSAKQVLPGLLASLQAAGWDVNRVVLETARRRARW